MAKERQPHPLKSKAGPKQNQSPDGEDEEGKWAEPVSGRSPLNLLHWSRRQLKWEFELHHGKQSLKDIETVHIMVECSEECQ